MAALMEVVNDDSGISIEILYSQNQLSITLQITVL